MNECKKNLQSTWHILAFVNFVLVIYDALVLLSRLQFKPLYRYFLNRNSHQCITNEIVSPLSMIALSMFQLIT